MAFFLYTQVATSALVRRNGSGIDFPQGVQGAEVQADTQNVRYTMDGSDPSSTAGMLFLTTEGPKYFPIDELKNIRFCASAGGAGNLNFHFHRGRNI